MNPVSERDFRIIQLSDCHLSADPDATYRGLPARAALEQVVAQARRWRPDLVLVTGDLSEDLTEESYASLTRVLDEFRAPVLTTPGNHDDPRLQLKYFPDTPLETPLVLDAGNWRLVVLNSSVPDEVPGALTDTMCEGLATALDERAGPKLIALHHQPVPVGSQWIDRYPLREPERLWTILDGRDDVRAVTWGHVHQVWRSRRDGIELLAAPSTVSNSLPFRKEFEQDPAGPACRWLKLGPGGRLVSGILRSAGAGWPGEAADNG
ncbi:MAG: phosphodiesterase [Xanthomonadales bacterium]|nr:phosphodiesterase [Xanthomonadales bacterium]NIX13043.1 phosphodiesterase [Xanthomonadales bacterium]